MPKIMFAADEEFKNYAPELIDKVSNVSSADELDDLMETYDYYDIIDAIYAISEEEGMSYGRCDEDSVLELLWDTFYESCCSDITTDYVAKRQTLKSKATPAEGAKIAVQVDWNRVLLVFDHDDGGWEYRLLDTEGNEIDAGGICDDNEKPLGELIEEVLRDYGLSEYDCWKLCDFDYYNDK